MTNFSGVGARALTVSATESSRTGPISINIGLSPGLLVSSCVPVVDGFTAKLAGVGVLVARRLAIAGWPKEIARRWISFRHEQGWCRLQDIGG